MLLVTGATGFVGLEVITQLAEAGVSATLLIRAVDEHHAWDKLYERLCKFHDPKQARAIADTHDIIVGDLERLPELPEFDTVLHLAADTSYWSVEQARRVNVTGSMALAQATSSAKRFVYCSAAMVCGDSPPHVVMEDDELDPTGHLVHYTATKLDAERQLHELLGDKLVIARPSVVFGHSELGMKPSGSIFWAVRAITRLGAVPSDAKNLYLDAVSVDWVACMLCVLAMRPALKHKVYHLSAGRGATNISQLFAAMGEPEPQVVYPKRYRELRERFKRVVDSPSALMWAAASKYYEFLALNVVFDNQHVLDEALPAPEPLLELVPKYLDTSPSIRAQFLDEQEIFRVKRGN